MKKERKTRDKKRIWRSIVTTLAAIVVFVTTYALIIPAITWEKTLICPLEEHVHTDKCFDSDGKTVCGKEEHQHTDVCFDAPKAAVKVFICEKADHTHTEKCYFSDGTLKCTLPEHVHTNACYNMSERTIRSALASDGAMAEISGMLPVTAQAEITAVPLSAEELTAYFGAEKAALMTGYVAYDIKIMVGDVEWQPDASVSVTVKHPNIDLGGGDQLGLAHVESGDNSVEEVGVKKDENGDIAFDANGFSLYIIYKSFTVDFSYGDYAYSMNGMESIRLSKLFTLLGIENDISDVHSAVFSDPSLLRVDRTEDSDWLLTSLQAFQTEETLTVTFADGTVIVIDTTDAVTGTTVTWDQTNKTATVSVTARNDNTWNSLTLALQHAASSSYTTDKSIKITKSSNGTLSYDIPKTGNIASYKNWRITEKVGSGSSTTTALGTINDLMDLISVSSSVTNNYNSAKFSAWLKTDYENNPAYLNPSAPTTMAELMTAFDYFYSGRNALPNVWCYHAGATEPYAKLYTLHDATTGNTALADGDVIELHGNIMETKQSVIQKSITLISDPTANTEYTIDFVTTNGDFIYEVFTCDKHPDPNVTIGTDHKLETRDCITICPATFNETGTTTPRQLEVLFKNVILDGFEASQTGNLWDNHLIQTIHNVELTLSGVTVQNYNITDDFGTDNSGNKFGSNGTISLDGRTGYNSVTGTYGNRLILKDDTVFDNNDSQLGYPYNTGGIALNSAQLDVYDAEFKNCDSRGGAAIMVDSSSVCTLHDEAYIHDCHGKEEGAAIRNSGTLYVEAGSKIEDCGPQTGSESTLLGGAIFSKGTLYISGGSIEGCTAANGGAVYNKGTLYVSGGSITDNTASDDPKNYDGVSATLGSGIYQNGTMYLSGAPAFDTDQDVYLPEGRVITKNGEITAEVKMPVVLEDETRFRDILVSQSGNGKTVTDANLLKFDVKLSKSAIATVDGKVKALAAVYSETGLNNAVTGSVKNVLELDVSDVLVVKKVWVGEDEDFRPEKIEVLLYKNGVDKPVDSGILTEANGWKYTFTNIEVNADGTVPYHVSEVKNDDYITTISNISFVDGLPGGSYYIKESDITGSNTFVAGEEYMLYGSSRVISHSNSTFSVISSSDITKGSTTSPITIGSKTYTDYYPVIKTNGTDKNIPDAAGWLYDSNKKLSNGGYYFRYNDGMKLTNNLSYASNVSISNSKIYVGSRYVVVNSSSISSKSDQSDGTAITLYRYVEIAPTPGNYEITITNTAKEYAELLVRKEWVDIDQSHRPASIQVEVLDSNNKVIKTLTLSASNDWQDTVKHLLVSPDGKLHYSVREIVPEGLDEWYVVNNGPVEYIAGEYYWAPAKTNQFTSGGDYLLYSNGYVIRRDGTTLKTTAVTRGVTVDGVTYSTYISGDAVKDILETAVWHAASYSNGYSLKNGDYYLKYKSDNPGYQLASSAGTATMYNNSKLRLYNGDSNRYLSVTTNGALPTSKIDSQSSASAFTLYQKVGDASSANGHFEAVITNREIEYTTLVVNKVWSDGNENHEGQSIKVTLHSSYGEPDVTKTLSSSNGWSVEFENLIVPGDGEKFGYTITEEAVTGYASFTSDALLIPGSEGTIWVPVTTIANGKEYLLVSNGYMVRHTGTGASIGAVAVEVGGSVVVDNQSFASSIASGDVTDADIWTAAKGNYSTFTLKNGNYYIANNNPPISTSASSLSLSATSYNSGLYRIRTGIYDDDDNIYYHLGVSGTTVSRVRGTSTASSFRFYEKRGNGDPTPDSYSITITNQKLTTAASDANPINVLTKKIDYLGDGGSNADTTLTGEEFYRLYLQSSANSQPVDLLIIADVSNSMRNNGMTEGNSGTTRYQVLDRILNGSVNGGYVSDNNALTASGASRSTDGLIYNFLNDNPENRVAVLGFARTAQIRTPGYTEDNDRRWVSKGDINSTNAKAYYTNIHLSPMGNSDTNYINAFVDAEGLLLQTRNSDSKLVIIFMTDGIPDGLYYNTGSSSIALSNTTDNNEAAGNNSADLLEDIFSGNYKGYYYKGPAVDNQKISATKTVTVSKYYDAANPVVRDYSDASVFVVGIGSEAATGVGKTVLDNMALNVNGESYVTTDAAQLTSDMNAIVDKFRTRVTLVQDTLSAYVNMAANPDIKITMRDPEDPEGTNEVTIYADGETTAANTQNGKAIIDSVTVNGKTITVKFTEDYKIDPRKIFTISYNVERVESTRDTPTDVGDVGTDYGSNATSAGKTGFKTNEKAYAIYTIDEDYYEGKYPHPVAQVPRDQSEPVAPPEIEYPEYGDDEVEIGKKIDYLGDNTGVEGMDDLYRLYLTLKAEKQPIDLLLVLDQSGSMAKTLAGGTADDTSTDPSKHSRQKIMLDFLNGTAHTDSKTGKTTYDGFISKFLAANDENDLAILTFSQDSGLNTTKRYIHQWGDSTDHITQTLTPEGGTNYMAALWAANEIWKLEAAKEKAEATLLGDDYVAPKKIMIFLSDGEPTYAYSDGKMQRGLAESNVVGNGYSYDQLYDFLQQYLYYCNSDASGNRTEKDYWRKKMLYNLGGKSTYDDDGALCSTDLNSISFKTDEIVKFPIVCQITGMDVDVPGMADWPLGEIDADVFIPWYNSVVSPALSGSDQTAYLAWAEESIKSVGDTYDLFWLSEWAYSEFAEANEDVITYTVGFSQDTDGKYGTAPAEGETDTRREKAEVLKYMSGADRFVQCDSASALSEALNSIALMSATLSDKLSEYVEFAVDDGFRITVSDDRYEDYYKEGDSFAYLYSEGKFTDLGKLLLDTSATKINKAAGTVSVVFKPGVSFDEELNIEASFTVMLTQKAYDDAASTGYTATGDTGTDYGGNTTSSGKSGFFSNDSDNAKAVWTRGGKHEEKFKKPVVQVYDLVDILLDKVNSGTVAIKLSGAEFDLYREEPYGKQGCITYTDKDGITHYLTKINTSSIVSDKDTSVKLEDMRVGRYYLFETKAPNGYVRLTSPVPFEISLDKIITNDANAVVSQSAPLLISIKNVGGHELPATGGMGTKRIYTLGGLLLAGALMTGFVLQRAVVPKERREDALSDGKTSRT